MSIADKSIPIKYRTIGLESGWSFFLPVEEFAEINCSDDPDGWKAREMQFTVSIEGTNKSASRMLYVQYWPAHTTACDLCPSPLSKLAGGNPEWVIKGANMNYSEIRFTVPLSILASGCSYSVYLTNNCHSDYIGNIVIDP